MDIERKSVDAVVTPVEDSTSKHGEFDVILSTSALDRDGDELGVDEWKTPLPEKISFDSDHGMSVATCVGSGRPFINDNGQLQVRGTFASTPHGQAVRTLVNEGHIDSVSVAFRNLKNQKDGKPSRELINGAFVVAPANPEARVLSSKAAKDDVEGPTGTLLDGVSVKDGDKKPYGDVTYADPKNNKYPVDTEAHVRAAWSYINMDKNASQYSAEELSAVKGRIKRAAEKFGIDIGGDKKAASNYQTDEMGAIADMFTMDGDASPQRKAYWQGVHDLAIKLGAGCPYSDPQATPDVLSVSNRSADHDHIESKSSPQESAEESATAETAEKSAVSATADESADDAVLLARKRLAIRLRSLDISD